MPNYESITTDCDIIAQKIESLRESLKHDKSEEAQTIDDFLFRAWNAIETTKEIAS